MNIRSSTMNSNYSSIFGVAERYQNDRDYF
jgi:hypothetical protein